MLTGKLVVVLALVMVASLAIAQGASKNPEPSVTKAPLAAASAVTTPIGAPHAGGAESWWDKLWSDPVATFTGVLAVVTGLLAWFTYQLWGATKRIVQSAENNAKILERAYLSGGGALDMDAGIFNLTVNNYGKSQAVLENLTATIRFEEGLPQEPIYDARVFAGMVIQPGTSKMMVARVPRPSIQDGQICYGRLFYKDIFGDRHSSGFILRLPSSTAVEGKPRYWVEDDPIQ